MEVQRSFNSKTQPSSFRIVICSAPELETSFRQQPFLFEAMGSPYASPSTIAMRRVSRIFLTCPAKGKDEASGIIGSIQQTSAESLYFIQTTQLKISFV